ncbi:class I SAM-dependent methyltransferase [Inconstantimicrobium mannanitabidum]|uniref:Uncharacterized protein n=1 Tax=Inconstantimicrobium mannanitabidum TaxID=1604901 RepID=A0ACB5RFS4_9CLOT|nr:class I SAM-dependent methyltransferase [Clostridium sp. TW13]GKX67925.1 hypothetical protein rsdtw13_31830 [Clostridium sp. TW13]
MNKTKQIKNIWDKVAHNFGEVGPRYWNEFGGRLVELSNINNGAKVLDIGMGRGASLFPAVDKIGENGLIVGIDYSEEMVKATQKDILLKGIKNAEVRRMNAQSLEFEENSFDNIICGFAIGILLFGEEKLNGVKRILKNGGQAAFSVWGVQEDQKWLTEIINSYLPCNNNTGKSNAPKFETIKDIQNILEQFDFKDIRVYEESNYVMYKSKEEWWQHMCTNAVRGIFDCIEELGKEQFNKFKMDVFKGLNKFNKGDGFYFKMPVIYAFGNK